MSEYFNDGNYLNGNLIFDVNFSNVTNLLVSLLIQDILCVYKCLVTILSK